MIPPIKKVPQYSTIPGPYDPKTGKPKAGYSTIPGPYDAVTGKLKNPPLTTPGLLNPIDYRKSIKDMGVDLPEAPDKPIDPDTLKSTYDILKQVNRQNKQLGIQLQVVSEVPDDAYQIPDDVYNSIVPIAKYDGDTGKPIPPDKIQRTKAAGVWDGGRKRMYVKTNSDMDAYKFELAHELGHYLGIGGGVDNEHLADAFAAQFVPGRYSYLNNPYLKQSWMQGYTAPNPLPTPQFPSY